MRYVRVTTLSLPMQGSPEKARQLALQWIERASYHKPDIICLPETFTGLGCGSKEWFESAEPVPGPTTEALSEAARQYHCYIICPLLERTDEGVYNSAILIDRKGEVIGKYHKVYPTIGEMEQGVRPGTETPVFETDFGRLGFAICFDLNFREVMEGLAKGHPEVIFFPSMYRGGKRLQVWALDFSVYIIAATPGEQSAMVDPLGRVFAESSPYEPILTRTINLDYVVCHIDYNHSHWDRIRETYGKDVEIAVASPEAYFALISHHPQRSAPEIAQEFGLEPLKDYYARARATRQHYLRQHQPILHSPREERLSTL